MGFRLSLFAIILVLLVSLAAQGQSAAPKLQNGGDFSTITNPTVVAPKDTILVRGAVPSASDGVTPVPEAVAIKDNILTDKYFKLSYALPAGWTQKFSGPPPSDSGHYTLAEFVPAESTNGQIKGHMELFAQDMFFTVLPAANALQMVNYSKNHLQGDYKVELKPTETRIGGKPFTFYAYWSPSAELHWYILATEIRCHTIQVVMTSSDTKLLQSLVQGLDKMTLPEEASPTGGHGGGDVPVCIKNYATDNVLERVDPILTEHRYSVIPVRIVIDTEGKVKYIHFLRAFSEQEKAITAALKQWKFRPYEQDGKRFEVETGLTFGRISRPVLPPDPDTSRATD
jgi:hypothetical protein